MKSYIHKIHEDMANHLKSSTHHFTSSEALLQCNDHMRLKFILFQGIGGLVQFW